MFSGCCGQTSGHPDETIAADRATPGGVVEGCRLWRLVLDHDQVGTAKKLATNSPSHAKKRIESAGGAVAEET